MNNMPDPWPVYRPPNHRNPEPNPAAEWLFWLTIVLFCSLALFLER